MTETKSLPVMGYHKHGKKPLPIIEFHILQSLPPSCVNRDDCNSPKSCVVGGVKRARVSSQCWKRAVREQLQQMPGIQLGKRTKLIALDVKEAILKLLEDDDAEAIEALATECAEELCSYLSKDSLYFISSQEAETIAKYAQYHSFDVKSFKAKEVYKELRALKGLAKYALDIALFGKMVAKAPVLNVEAASQFAHAISTHKSVSEVDFFTALDDNRDIESDAGEGAGHMGTSEFISATYYRYVSLNLNVLVDHFGGETDQLPAAIEAFTKALFLAIPGAKQSSMAAWCGWDYCRCLVRTGQNCQVSFNRAVRAKGDGGYLAPSIEHVEQFLADKQKMHGSLWGGISEYTLMDKDTGSIDTLCEFLKEAPFGGVNQS